MSQQEHRNLLYPVFLKLDKLNVLIVGAGEVGYEKLYFMLKSSPNARVTVVASWISQQVKALLADSSNSIQLVQKDFEENDVLDFDIVIAATNDHALNLAIHKAAKAARKIVNVADTPDLCDFYMGSIVTKGDLKVAISTNGKSPTFAKRFRQMLEELLPDDTESLILNLKVLRDRMKDGFTEKVKKLNKLTESLVNN